MNIHPQETSLGILPEGVGSLVDPVADFAFKPEFDNNSWFAIGHFEVDGELLNFLYHVMVLPLPGGGRAVQACISITNETTGWYRAEDVIVPLEEVRIASTGFDIEMPNGRLSGDLDYLHVKARLDDGKGEVEVEARRSSKVILNGGTGMFPLIGMKIHQYSVPRLDARGNIRIEDDVYRHCRD